VANKQVAGMIGPYNSAVGKAEIPITNPAQLTMISPSNTNPCLTHEQQPPLPTCSYHPAELRKGKPNNYFRVVTTDDLQGPAMAQFAYDTLGVKNVGVLDEKTVFGVGIAGAFDSKFKALGGKTIRDSFDPATTNDWRNYLSRFNDGGAKGVYMGGTDDQKACEPRAQMPGAGVGSWPYMGGDGIQTTQCIDDAQDGAIGLYATTAGADATKVQSAQSTIQEFKKTFTGANDYGAYTMQGYDAANILIESIRKALKAGKDPNKTDAFRAAVRDNVASINYTGVLGQYTFDKNGDTSLKIISVYQVKDVGAQAAAAGDLVCGTKHPTYCYSWVKQFNFGSNK
jgi:branched-chain amino acid transport system substrate-binding protein